MRLLDKVGKMAMDAVDKAIRATDGVRKLGGKLVPPTDHDEVVAPDPEPNESPFAVPEQDEEHDAPLGDPETAAQVFGRGTDPWTGRSLQLLKDHQVEHSFVDLEADGGMAIDTALVRETQQHQAPYVYLRGEFIGGYDALNEVVRLGQLDELTKRPEDRNKGGGVRIVIAKRTQSEVRPGEIGNPDDRQ